MKWWHPEEFTKKKEALKTRQHIIKQCRSFFDGQGFDEVQTPVLQIMASPDTHIHAFETTQIGRNLKLVSTLGLHTSPEIAMKKLLVAGMEKIYQICPVFRNGEEGRLHSPEFTMLEWYRTGTDYTAMMEDCESLIKSLGLFSDTEFERITVAEAFEKCAHININEDLKPQAESLGIRTIDTDSFEDIFHAIMAEKIEPHLGQGAPIFLIDYPTPMAALAKKCGNIAERFELYINGIEIANAFSELTDAKEQRTRLEDDMAQKKALYGVNASIDEDFLEALECGMPESSGCALGLDRLIMIACDADNIDDVLWCDKL